MSGNEDELIEKDAMLSELVQQTKDGAVLQQTVKNHYSNWIKFVEWSTANRYKDPTNQHEHLPRQICLFLQELSSIPNEVIEERQERRNKRKRTNKKV